MKWLFLLFLILVFTPGVYAENLILDTKGKMTIELLTSDALYHNTLGLESPKEAGLWKRGCNIESNDLDVAYDRLLMSEKTSQHGCRAELDAGPGLDIDPFEAGTILEFKLCSQTNDDAKCEYVWSSDSSKNSDGREHVKITKLHNDKYPGRIYQLNWEDLPRPDDSYGDFNDLVAIVRLDMDTDEDGLWDDWEFEGIDTDADGNVNYKLSGANPGHKDIYLEIDYMDCAKGGAGICIKDKTHSDIPTKAAMDNLISLFANAPIKNKDGKDGITLHYEIDDPIPHQDTLEFSGKNTQFDDIKNNPAYFGPDNPRRFAYHYALFIHGLAAPLYGKTGQGEQGGNDFVVSLGDVNSDLEFKQTSTTMHELGHNLGLSHGGEDDINYKPNYLSVMNYHFQTVGIPPNKRIDYSRSALPTIDENHLDESKGIQDGTDNTYYRCLSHNAEGKGTGPIDWNCNTIIETDVKANLADADSKPGVVEYTELKGYDDWKNLKYAFHDFGDFEDGVHINVGIPDEIERTGEVHGKKWDDINGNGIKDSGEPGLENWTVFVKYQDVNMFQTSTDIDGNYNIIGITDGDYTVGEIVKEGYIQTYPKSGTHTVKIENGSILQYIDFGNFKLGEIHGTKFEDVNGNGIMDSTDHGIPGWSITLTGPSGSVNNVTDPDGRYDFYGLIPGTYTVTENVIPGWIQTAPEISTSGSATYTVTITTSGTVITGKDFGNFKLGEVHGTKWEDLNANSKKDSFETGLAGWEINIKGTDTITGKEVNIIMVTDANGNYSFKNLTAGTYVISEKLKDGWVQTTPVTGSYTVTITSSANIIGQDFGNFHKGKITGGGQISVPGDPKATFGLEGKYKSGIAQGNVEYQDHAAKLNIKSIQINTVATTTDKKRGVITGLVQVNGAGKYPFEIYVEDNGEPGKEADVFKISLPTYSYSNGAVLNSGNIQIHE